MYQVLRYNMGTSPMWPFVLNFLGARASSAGLERVFRGTLTTFPQQPQWIIFADSEPAASVLGRAKQ